MFHGSGDCLAEGGGRETLSPPLFPGPAPESDHTWTHNQIPVPIEQKWDNVLLRSVLIYFS